MSKTSILKTTLEKTTKILAGSNVPVYMEGFAPRVEFKPDGEIKAVYIPAVPDNVSQKLINAIHGFIDHETAHLHFSSRKDVVNTSKSKLWHFIHNCVDDPRINHLMGQKFVGSKKNIKSAYDFAFNNFEEIKAIDGGEKRINFFTKEVFDKLDLTNEKVRERAELLYAPLFFDKHYSNGQPLCADMYDSLGLDKLYKPLLDRAGPELKELLHDYETTEDVSRLADGFAALFDEETFKEMDEQSQLGKGRSTCDSDDSEEGKGKGKGKSKGDGNGDEKGDPTQDDDRPDEVEIDPNQDIFMESIASPENRLINKITMITKDKYINSKMRSYWTDRYDVTVTPQDMIKPTNENVKKFMSERTRRDERTVKSFEDSTKRTANYVMKDVRRLLEARKRQYYVGGYKSGKIDQKSLHTVKAGNVRIFKKKNEVRGINAAVGLLIDMSGSMSSYTKITVAMESAMAMAMVLEQFKIPFEIYGFTTFNCPTVRSQFNKLNQSVGGGLEEKTIDTCNYEVFYAFKDFDTPFNYHCKASLAKASSGGFSMNENEDSKHVYKALQRLSVRPEENKSLFIFSDGHPAYGCSAHKSQQQLKALDECAKSTYGVNIYSIGIQSEAVSLFYKKYAVVEHLRDLPTALFKFLKEAI